MTSMPHEEGQRAELYALLAALLAAPPAAELYARLRAAPGAASSGADAPLAASFGALVAAARRLERDAVRDEYDALFQGTAKAEVMLHSSYYLAGALNEAPLVALRDDLRAIGLEGDPALGVTEDHIACLCEVMQHLIGGGNGSGDAIVLVAQRRFFGAHVAAWNGRLWDALAAHPRSDFYRAVARFGRDFLEIEAQAFEMLDAAQS